MKIYKAKTVFHGIKLGKRYADKLNVVAVPAGKGFTHVEHRETVNKLEKPITRKHFKDKFKKDSFYTLEYYEFNPEYDLFMGEA